MPTSAGTERWHRVKAAFFAALDHPEAERDAIIGETCGDDADLRREVESLLANDEQANSLFDIPAASLLAPEVLELGSPPRRLIEGSRIGHYEVSGFVGAGGMGEVYKARDTRLGRHVAIKTVTAESGGDIIVRQRLLREARYASVLAHPNVCTIHEVIEVDDLPFIVMEFIDGTRLDDIVREGPVPLDRAAHYASQIANALEHAHTHGIVHRDLKSSNVMIGKDGRVVVLDFGLAGRLPATDDRLQESTEISMPGMAGTLSHMAPEVLHGQRADERSDVWALGVLLYQLVTSELPFTGRTSFETSSSILGDPPKPIHGRAPFALRLVIERCLAKQPAARYQQAADVRAALASIKSWHMWPLVAERLIPARRVIHVLAAVTIAATLVPAEGDRFRAGFPSGAGPPMATLAVLPIETIGKAVQDFYAQGVTESLTTQLGGLSELRVISAASTAHAARLYKTSAEIGRSLGASVVMQITIGHVSDDVQVRATMIDSTRGAMLWSATYEASARDVLVMEAQIVRDAAQGLRVRLRPNVRSRLMLVPAVDPQMYEAYLQGRYYWNQRTAQSLQTAVAYFTRAVELNPAYAPAHAALADCYNQLGTVLVGTGSPYEYRPLAAAAAIKALQIDPATAEAHAALGYVRHYDLQWAEAEEEFRRAIALDPSYAMARVWYGNMLMSRRRFDEAVEQVFAARTLDPFSLVVNTNVGWILNSAGRTTEAIQQLTRTVQLDPEYPQARMRLAGALTSAGRFDEALVQDERFVQLTSRSPTSLALLAEGYARAGRTREVRPLLEQILAARTRGYVPPASIARVYVALGDVSSAVDWFERAYDERSNAIAYLAVGSDVRLRQDPRFLTLLRRAGLE